MSASVEIWNELSRTATGKPQQFKVRAPFWDASGR